MRWKVNHKDCFMSPINFSCHDDFLSQFLLFMLMLTLSCKCDSLSHNSHNFGFLSHHFYVLSHNYDFCQFCFISKLWLYMIIYLFIYLFTEMCFHNIWFSWKTVKKGGRKPDLNTSYHSWMCQIICTNARLHLKQLVL